MAQASQKGIPIKGGNMIDFLTALAHVLDEIIKAVFYGVVLTPAAIVYIIACVYATLYLVVKIIELYNDKKKILDKMGEQIKEKLEDK